MLFRLANWRKYQMEVDLVMQDGDLLVLVEVKTRKNEPEELVWESIGRKKENQLAEAAEWIGAELNWEGEIRIDVVFVHLGKGEPSFSHFPGAL